jgi:hypothetical protein
MPRVKLPAGFTDLPFFGDSTIIGAKVPGNTAHAVNGNWVVTSADTGDFHVANYVTGADHDIGAWRGYDVYPLGTSRFLFHQQGAPGETFIVDPTQLTS